MSSRISTQPETGASTGAPQSASTHHATGSIAGRAVTENTPLLELPPELLQMILGMTDPETVAAAQQTCTTLNENGKDVVIKQWREAGSDVSNYDDILILRDPKLWATQALLINERLPERCIVMKETPRLPVLGVEWLPRKKEIDLEQTAKQALTQPLDVDIQLALNKLLMGALRDGYLFDAEALVSAGAGIMHSLGDATLSLEAYQLVHKHQLVSREMIREHCLLHSSPEMFEQLVEQGIVNASYALDPNIVAPDNVRRMLEQDEGFQA